ncbi:hypothetical protein JVU11DRAFT_2112 [Chiua virens]|nr:hypothetical protein JVU11DRAFT_2112 [Chiua virens]
MKDEIAMCNDLASFKFIDIGHGHVSHTDSLPLQLLTLRGERLESLKQAISPSASRESRDTYTEQFFSRLDKCQRLEHHIDTLKKNAEDRRISSRTRTAAKRTGYHGIVDWAERTSQTHDNLLDATAKVAFVGAGLTYGSIFSASRGNIGLMCYAFALFDCGFIIPTVALALLKWASLRPKDTLFCSPHTWTLILNIFAYVSVAAVGAAICLLNMTLYLLVFPRNSSGQPTNATLQLYISPTPAGSLSLGCLLLSMGIVLICALIHYLARGKNAFIQDFIGHRPGQTREQETDRRAA